MENIEKIKECRLFKGLNISEITHLMNFAEFQVRHFKPEGIIALADEEMKHLMLVLEGNVRGEMVDYTGKTIKIENISAPNTLAQAFLFGKSNLLPVNVVANTNASIMYIPKANFTRMLQQNTTLMVNFLDLISSRAQFLSDKIKFFTFKTIREKIALFILEQAGSKLNSINISESQQQMAELFGVTRPSLSRALNEMKTEGIIDFERGIIRILQFDKLNEMIKK